MAKKMVALEVRGKDSRSGLAPFAKAASTIRKHGEGILAALGLKINNARESPIYPAGLRLLTPSLVQMPTTSV